jgi:hypothetical protein
MVPEFSRVGIASRISENVDLDGRVWNWRFAFSAQAVKAALDAKDKKELLTNVR